MASLVLGAVGSALGGAGTAFTVAGTAVTWGAIGGAVGTAVGSVVDAMLVSALMPGQSQGGARLSDLRVTSATEGAVIPRLYGRMKVGGNLIWATDFRERVQRDRVGGKGGGGSTVKSYTYSASFAVALCEGPITGIGRIWADGKPFRVKGAVWRLHRGTEDQDPDPHILALSGGAAPAYRGVAYVVFENLPLERFGNRIPQLSFEVFRAPEDDRSAETLIRSVTMIPGTGEYVYGVTPVSRGSGGTARSENQNARPDQTDFLAALDDLEAAAPNCDAVTLVVAWFGTDLRCGSCLIRPQVEDNAKVVTQTWRVNGILRPAAAEVSAVGGVPVYGGTPSDHTVVAAIQELKARGYRVTLLPFVLMDIPAGNSLPNPYSDSAGDAGQPVYPWRGRITCSPAAGFAGTVDKTATAATQVSAFFGAATASDFAVSGGAVSWIGGADWGYRRMVLHYARLCAVAGGVDSFLIGSELRGVTQIRSGAATYPAVAELVSLAAAARGILGSGTEISYAADWSEYFGHQPADGSGDVHFHLDPLWADAEIDFVGIDAYLPLADWREGAAHLDAADHASTHDPAYLQANIEGGEHYDWFYADDAARAAQTRTPITDGAYAKPWVFRPKDLRGWWSHQHFNRPGGVESGTATAWVPESKPIRFTETGCPAVDKGANQPNVFFDPKSSESALPWFSRGTPDDLIQRRYIEALIGYWADTANNPASGVYSGRMIDVAGLTVWTWDARPFPAFPARSDVWGDAGNWRLGHWLTGRIGAANLSAVVRDLCRQSGLPDQWVDTSALQGTLSGYAVTGLDSARGALEPLRRFFAFDAVETQGVIRFVSRSGVPIATIDPDDMVAPSEGTEPFVLTRAQETDLARARKWRVIDADADFEGLTVEARRSTVDTARITAESFDIAAPGHVADRAVRRALWEEWAGRETASFRLPPSRLALDATDVLALAHDGRALPLVVTSVADGDARTIEARRVDPVVYDLPVGAGRPVVSPPPVVHGPAAARMLALPQLSEDADPRAAWAAVQAEPWWGTALVQWSPAADVWTDAATGGVPARIGALVDALPYGPLHRLDLANSLLVDLSGAALESLSDEAMLSGSNAIAVESSPGVWEVIQFGTAELVSTDRWRLRRLLRGQLGTEDAIGAPTAAGATVVLLDEGLMPAVLPVADLGSDIGWRALPYDAAEGDEAITAMTFDHQGRGLRPYSPCQLRAVRSGSDWVLSWLRRSRNPAADNWTLSEVPQDETTEAYQVEILSGLTVLRSVTVTAVTTWTYSAALQTADFGAPVSTLTFRVAQWGQLGPGARATATF